MIRRLGNSIRLRFQTDLQNISDGEDINRASENIKENIKTSAKENLGLQELKQHKPWFDEECLRFLDQRKQAKMQSIQDHSQSNVDDLNKVRREASKHFREGEKKKEYLKSKIECKCLRIDTYICTYRHKYIYIFIHRSIICTSRSEC